MKIIERGAVYGGMWGEDIVGFRCSQCGRVFQKMWGNVCNGCRKRNEQHRELIKALKEK